MKRKKTKTGLVTALGGLVTMLGCNAQPGKPIAANNVNTDSIKLEQRLKELSQTKYEGELAWGAMCYDAMAPVYVDYICSHCGHTIREKYDNWIVGEINLIEEFVTKMGKLGYDVILDKTEYCPCCSERDIKNPELIFKIRFSAKADYHIARSNIANEYQCMLAFLSNEDKYKGHYDEEHALHDNVAIIQKMTGLGKDLVIEKQ